MEQAWFFVYVCSTEKRSGRKAYSYDKLETERISLKTNETENKGLRNDPLTFKIVQKHRTFVSVLIRWIKQESG